MLTKIAIFAAVPIAAVMFCGCNSSELAACTQDNEVLHQQVAALRTSDQVKNQIIANLNDRIDALNVRIAELEAVNKQLQERYFSETSEGRQRVGQGVEELRRLQREAGGQAPGSDRNEK